MIIAGEDTPFTGVDIIATRSNFYPETEDAMGWDISEKGFRIVLAPGVPEIIREHLATIWMSFWQTTVSPTGHRSWIIHTGGPKVLRAVESALEFKAGRA